MDPSDAPPRFDAIGMTSKEVEALRAFYVSQRQSLYTYAVALARSREAAEDAIHAVFQRLLSRSELPRDLKPFVYASVRNALRDVWRKESPYLDAAIDLDAFEGPRSADHAAITAYLGELSQDEREAILLKLRSGFTFQEIAHQRGVPLATVTSWYRRGLEKLRASPLRNEL